MKNNEYDCIFSIGRDCCCASYLIWHKLRYYSGPFDWITNAQFSDCAELICNDMKDFINLEDLAPLPKRTDMFNDDKCDYYVNKKTHYAYFHDFPAGQSLEKSYNEVHEKYRRRIERFNLFLKYAKRPLLIWMCHSTNTSDEEISRLCKQICDKYGKKVQFCFVEHDHNNSYCHHEDDIKIYNLAPNIRVARAHIRVMDKNNIPEVFGNKERYDDIIKKFNITFKKPRSFTTYVMSKITSKEKREYYKKTLSCLYRKKKHIKLKIAFIKINLKFTD